MDLAGPGPACRLDRGGVALIMVACAADAAGCRPRCGDRHAGHGDPGTGHRQLAAGRAGGRPGGQGGAPGAAGIAEQRQFVDAAAADDVPGRTPPGREQSRGRGKRKPGKQPGAPGSHLAWSEHPDDRVPHFPEGTCECGADLGGAADLGVAASHQQVEIPLAPARVIQHDLHALACTCGRVHQAAAPAGAGAPGTVTYGLNLQAWCVFLVAAHAIPVHRCAELIEALSGARPSPGFVHAMLARAAAAAARDEQADPGADHPGARDLRR